MLLSCLIRAWCVQQSESPLRGWRIFQMGKFHLNNGHGIDDRILRKWKSDICCQTESNKVIQAFEEIKNSKHTAVFYESVHRIVKTLNEMKEVLEPDREILVARELTKKFETIYRGKVSEIIPMIKEKGEFVVVVKS